MVSISHAFLPPSSLKCHNLAESHSSQVFRPMFTFTHFYPCPLRDSKDFHGVIFSFFSHALATLARRRAMLNENLRFGISPALSCCVFGDHLLMWDFTLHGESEFFMARRRLFCCGNTIYISCSAARPHTTRERNHRAEL